MRDWDRLQHQTAAANVVVYILTPDAPEVAARAARAKKLKTPLIPVSPEVWAAWGVTNPKKPKLPHPSTFVLGPDGTVQTRITHADYTKRADVDAVLKGLPQPSSSTSDEPNWDEALELSTSRHERGLRLTLDIADGFHVYGAKERTARPLQVRVDGRKRARVKIPSGTRRTLGDAVGEAWVLEGRVELDLAGEAPATGDLDVQLCTDNACSPPQTLRWSVE